MLISNSVAFTKEQFYSKCLCYYSVSWVWNYTSIVTASFPRGQRVNTQIHVYHLHLISQLRNGALRRTPEDLIEDKPILIQVLAWCHQGPLLLTWISFNPAWINNHMPAKMWDENTYPSPHFNGFTTEVWKWIIIFFLFYNGCNYLSMLGLNSIHVSKRGPRKQTITWSKVEQDLCTIWLH